MKIWTDNPRGPDSDIIPQGSVNLGSADQPFNAVYANSLVADTEVIDNNVYLKAANVAGTGTLDLLKADATDNTVVNAKTGKIGKLAVNGTTVGTWDSNSIDFPAFNLTDGSDKNYALTVYAAGTAYTLTAVSAALDFGTTDPVITLNKAGTYLLFSTVNYQFVGATFAANRTVTSKLRRTNNTPADVTGSSIAIGTNIVTTVNGVLQAVVIPAVLYTTANLDDAITIYSDVSVIPTAGTLQATEASIVAIRLY